MEHKPACEAARQEYLRKHAPEWECTCWFDEPDYSGLDQLSHQD